MGDSLLQSQRNEALLTIKRSGINLLEFRLIEQPPLFPRIVHSPSEFFFEFGSSHVTLSPGAETRKQKIDKLNWAGKVTMLEIWLAYLKREIDAPDLWGSLASEKQLLELEPSTELNSQFNEAEQERIELGVEEIRSYIIKTQTLSDEKLRKVNAKLDYLINASKQLGRIHWKDIFVSTLLTIAWQLALPAPDFHDLISFAGQILRQLLGTVLSPPLLH